jgi:ABC-type phosphate/phosphonate transport system substrate-binding protein
MNDESKIVALGANARMYAVNAQVAALWERLFAWIAEDADVPLAIVEHPAPQPLPSPARYDGRPVYCTDIVVRRDSPHTDVDSLRGARFGYTVEHSQSGWHAPRAHLATRALAAGGRWLGEVVGPLVTPRAVIDAVLAGRVDAGPLDSWWHDLLRTHEPAVAATLRTVGSTPMTPIPPLVCAAATPHAQRERLAATHARAGNDPALRDLRDALLLRGFVRLAADD